MANIAQARDGRMSLAYLLEPASTETTTGTLAVGDIVVITGKATTGSVFGNAKLYHFMWVNKSISISSGSGDKCIKCTPRFLGQATGKTLSYSKNTTDVTIDYDEKTNNVTDGMVTMSGSISGSYITENLTSTSGLNMLKKSFYSITEVAADGSITMLEADTTSKLLLMIIWNGRNAKSDDILDADIVPAFFSNLSKGGQYNSSQTFDVDFTGNDTDENGYVGGNLQVHNATGLVPKFTRADYNA